MRKARFGGFKGKPIKKSQQDGKSGTPPQKVSASRNPVSNPLKELFEKKHSMRDMGGWERPEYPQLHLSDVRTALLKYADELEKLSKKEGTWCLPEMESKSCMYARGKVKAYKGIANEIRMCVEQCGGRK